jgi:hypothetical protein
MDDVYALKPDESNYNFVYSIVQFDLDEGNVITGGYAYEGNIESLKNTCIFGDVTTRRVFYLNNNDIQPG